MVNGALTMFGAPDGRMKLGLRLASIAAIAGALAAAGISAPCAAATVNAKAKAKLVKPLVLQSLQDFDLGTLVLAPGTWAGATVTLSQAGALACPANVTCTGLTQVAQYNVAGSNNQLVAISVGDVTLVNQSDSSKTLKLSVDAPASVMLTNSGPPGTNFSIGGSITLDSSTVGGVYAGTLEVTADYQ